MMLSFIIPAYNESALIGRTIDRITAAARALGEPFEIIVVDDASSDDTASIAAAQGARVVSVSHRQIAATRNSGAAEARGEVLIFVDADTILPDETLRAAVRAIQDGAVGGGARVQFEGEVNWLMRFAIALFSWVWFGMRLAAGCFIFARREAFEAVGGFDEHYYVSEELWLSRALRRNGRFVILRQGVSTSSRKLDQYGRWRLLWMAVRLILAGPRAYRRREGLELWYDGQRPD
jgi:glycosyltransferase involved in cell wall biosynthesis